MYRLQHFFKREKPTQPNWSFLHNFSPSIISNSIRTLLHSGVKIYFPEFWDECAVAIDLLKCCTTDGQLLGWDRLPQLVKKRGLQLPTWSCLMRLAIKMWDLLESRPRITPGFLKWCWTLTTFLALLFSCCNCTSKLRFEDNIAHVSRGYNSTDFHRVVFMQKRLEFVLKITQPFESQASGCFKNI